MNRQGLPTFTPRQLSLRNGQDRPEVWCAFDGLIYDLTTSRLWQSGQHYGHWAGQDLTTELGQAPHSAQVLQRFPVIGQLCL